MSARTRSDKGSSVTSWPVSTRPPRFSKCRTRASVRLCAPPRRIGQPLVCPAAINVNPTAADAVVSNGRMEWVDTPAKRARALFPAKRERAKDVAEDRAGRPNRASTNGLLGICRMGLRISSVNEQSRKRWVLSVIGRLCGHIHPTCRLSLQSSVRA